MITEFEIEGFKSFGLPGPKIGLGELNFLVGPNASGKSNLLAGLRFLKNAVMQDVEYAVDDMGGPTEVRNKRLRQRNEPKPIRLRTKIEKTIETKGFGKTWRLSSFHYEVSMDLRSDASSPKIEKEELRVLMSENGRESEFLLQRDATNLLITDPMRPAGKEKQEITVPEGEATRLALSVGFYTLPCVILREEIRNWHFYNINPSVARLPYREGPDLELGHAGESLAVILHQIERQDGERGLDEIVSGLQGAVQGFRGIKTQRIPVEGKWAFQVIEDKIRSGMNPASVSDGTVRLLALLTIATWTARRASLIAIEEPENGIHPHLFEHIIEILRAASRGNQFVLTTHNPAFLDHLEPHEVLLCDKRDGFTRIKRASDVDEIDLFREHFRLGELWVQGTLGGIL